MAESSLPIWCQKCDKQGFILVDDLECPYFVICERCGWETSQVFCPTCQMGGEFVREIEKRPTSWVCSDCDTRYELPVDFYKQPESICLETTSKLDSQFLYQEKLDVRFLHGKKQQLLIVGGLLAGPFLLFVPFMISSTNGGPLWPLVILLLLNISWSLFVGIAHRSISWSEFEALLEAEQRRRLYYESVWYYLYVGGLAFFGAVSCLWGAALAGYWAKSNVLFERVIGVVLCLGISIMLFYFGARALSIARTQFQQLRRLSRG